MLSLYGNLLLFSRHSAGAERSASLRLGPATKLERRAAVLHSTGASFCFFHVSQLRWSLLFVFPCVPAEATMPAAVVSPLVHTKLREPGCKGIFWACSRGNQMLQTCSHVLANVWLGSSLSPKTTRTPSCTVERRAAVLHSTGASFWFFHVPQLAGALFLKLQLAHTKLREPGCKRSLFRVQPWESDANK